MNVVKDEVMEELIISNEDFEKYFADGIKQYWKHIEECISER